MRAPEPLAMLKAVALGDLASADAIARFALPLAEEEPFSDGTGERNHRGLLAGMLMREIFYMDNPHVLHWLLEKSPLIAEASLRGIPSSWLQPLVALSDPQAIKALRWHEPLKITLSLLAAASGAIKCFDYLMTLRAHKEALVAMQAEPEAFAWEGAFATVSPPELVGKMAAAGFDFTRPAGGMNYVGAMLFAKDFEPAGLTGAWLRMVGEKFSEQLDPSPETGLTVFGEAIARNKSGPYWAERLAAAETVCQKAALRSQMGRATPIKAAQRRSAKARL